jgi:acyl-CoA thioester hydrolase
MRHNPLRLQLATYPHRTETELRFADIDSQMHVNNVRVGEFYQEARVTFFRRLHDMGYQRPPGSRTLVAHQSIDYLHEITYPASIVVGLGVSRIGRTSWHLGMGLFCEERCVGLSTAVLVYGSEAGATAIPAEYRSGLELFMLPANALT